MSFTTFNVTLQQISLGLKSQKCYSTDIFTHFLERPIIPIIAMVRPALFEGQKTTLKNPTSYFVKAGF